MRENKFIGIACIIISVIALIIAILLNRDIQITYDIFMNLFGGALLSGIIAIISYNCQKQEKISELKIEIKSNIDEYKDVFFSIEYVYFSQKLKDELKKLNKYEENQKWFENFISSNKAIMQSNIHKLKKLRLIDGEKIQKELLEIKKIDKKIDIDNYDFINKQIMKIENLTGYFCLSQLNSESIYEDIQNIIYECQDENGEKTDNSIKVMKEDVYPTNKVNIICKNLEKIKSRL